MIYNNPIVKGFYPDPSVCRAGEKFYMVNSSFQYFPGVPLWESEDLVNWKPIGHVLTRKSQVMLEKINSSGGVFAPTIRYHEGRFYMVTTNDTTHQNFYVFTDDIYSEWSEPIPVAQDGIDPSLYFEDGKTFFMSNGTDDEGVHGVVQCEIDVLTGEKLSKSRCIWQGTGGRYLESPHLYKINGHYYIMAAEGGTEYGHMIVYGRGNSPWGPFENYAKNPVLTNRNKAPYIIQGIGHGDLIQDKHGNWYILSLGFRQLGIWMPYHQLGREVFLTPVAFDEQGWFTAGNDGTTEESYEIPGNGEQVEKTLFTFANTDWNKDWCFLRHPEFSNYELDKETCILTGTKVTLDDVDNPTFLGIRQREFCGEVSCAIELLGEANGEAGLTAYMNEAEHYEIALERTKEGTQVLARLNIGGIKHVQRRIPITGAKAKLKLVMDNNTYSLVLELDGKDYTLAVGQAKYLTSEVSGGFTGVVLGCYCTGETKAAFTKYCYQFR